MTFSNCNSQRGNQQKSHFKTHDMFSLEVKGDLIMNAIAIHQRFTEKVRNERKSMHEVLLGIIEVEDSRTYAEFGYSSL